MEISKYLQETPWETRNLRIPSYVLNTTAFCSAPDVKKLKVQLKSLKYEKSSFFIFARIPREQIHLIQLLEQVGFYVIECTVSPFIRLHNYERIDLFEQNKLLYLPEKFRSASVKISTVDLPDNTIASNIKSLASESFLDDRFHVDYNCPTEIADQRFAYWVDDLVNNEKVSFDLMYIKDEIAGFMARKENELILAGFSKAYRASGLGEYLWLTSCSIIKELSHKTAETLISINNIPVLNLYARLGFRFKDTQYGLHYWSH
jgi:hypothetical protein